MERISNLRFRDAICKSGKSEDTACTSSEVGIPFALNCINIQHSFFYSVENSSKKLRNSPNFSDLRRTTYTVRKYLRFNDEIKSQCSMQTASYNKMVVWFGSVTCVQFQFSSQAVCHPAPSGRTE